MVYLSPPHRENRLRPYHVTFSASPAGQVPAGYPVLQNQLATADTVNATSSQQQWKSPLGYTVTQFTLGNGHKLLVEERPTTNFIALRTFVDAGSILENAVLPSPHYNDINLPSGIAHLDEHCRFLTTEHFPVKNTWTQAVNNMGSRWNASTSPEVIQHELFFNREDLPRMLQLHAESILRPTYNQTDLPQEKRNVINEATLRTRKPGSKIYNKLSELLFSRPDDQTLGLEQDVSRTTPVDLQYFRQLAYAPKNMVTLVSGNVNPDEVRRILEPELLKNPVKNRVINTPSTKLTLQPNQILSAVVTDPQLSNSVVSFAFPAPSRSSFKERVAMEFIDDMLNGTALSPFQEELVSRQQVSNGVSTSYDAMKTTGSYTVSMETHPGNEQQALTNAMAIIKQLSTVPVSPASLDTTSNRLVQRFLEAQTSVGSATMDMGSEAISGTLPYYARYAEIAKSITPADILSTAQKYLQPGRYVVVYGVSGNASQKQPVSTASLDNTGSNAPESIPANSNPFMLKQPMTRGDY